MSKSIKKSIFRPAKMIKKAIFGAQKWAWLISRKILWIKNIWNFHTVWKFRNFLLISRKTWVLHCVLFYRVLSTIILEKLNSLNFFCNFRLQTGMRGAFGKPQGLVARVNIGQPLMSVRTYDKHKESVIEALRRTKFKFPGRQKVNKQLTFM